MNDALIWGTWFAATAGTFAVLEGKALLDHRARDTFSWQVWGLERKYPVLRFAILAGLSWLAMHFLVG